MRPAVNPPHWMNADGMFTLDSSWTPPVVEKEFTPE